MGIDIERFQRARSVSARILAAVLPHLSEQTQYLAQGTHDAGEPADAVDIALQAAARLGQCITAETRELAEWMVADSVDDDPLMAARLSACLARIPT